MRKDLKVYLKVAGFIAAFVTLAAVTAMFLDTGRNLARAPASDEYDSDGNIIFSSESVDDLDREHRRSFGGTRASRNFGGRIFVDGKDLSQREASQLSGLQALRGRRVRFDEDAFSRLVRANSRKVELNLFADYLVIADLGAPSVYSQNQGIYTGTLASDPHATVRLMVQGFHTTGTIETKNRKFHILDMGDGSQLIIEEDNKRL